MNKHPKLKFQLNRELDNEMAFQFLDISAGGIDFGKGIIEIYPELANAKTISGDSRRVVINEFTKKYYRNNRKRLNIILQKIRWEWDLVAKDFYQSVDKVFEKQIWPEGKYICYLSIFDCNPRFLEDKTFQVWMGLSDRTNYVIAHEMLHFMFFDYLEKGEVDFKNKHNENTIWLLSEWFNDLVLNLPIFKQFGQNVKSAYPEVVKFSKQFGRVNTYGLNIPMFFELVKSKIDKR